MEEVKDVDSHWWGHRSMAIVQLSRWDGRAAGSASVRSPDEDAIDCATSDPGAGRSG